MPRSFWRERKGEEQARHSQKSKRSTTSSEQSEQSASRSTSTEGEKTKSATWKALFYFTTRAHIPALIFGLCTAIISGLSSPAQALLIGKAFGVFSTYGTGGITAQSLLHQETKYILYMVAVGAASWFVRFVFFASWLAFGELQAKSARDRLFIGLLHKDLAWYDRRKNGIGALLPRVQIHIRELQIATSQPLGSVIEIVANAFFSFGLAMYYSWKLTLVIICTIPVMIVVLGWLGIKMQPHIMSQFEKLNEALKHLSNAINCIETVKCFNGQQTELLKYSQYVSEAASIYAKYVNINATQAAFMQFMGSAMFVQAFYYGGTLVASHQKSTGDVVTTFMAALSAFSSISGIITQLLVLENGRTAGATLRVVICEVEGDTPMQLPSPMKRPEVCLGNINLRHVSFSYPSRPDRMALQDMTLRISAGETTFIIGRSGSGKSTLGQLLLQFYKAKSGSISIDGHDIESLDPMWLRERFTLVEQSSTLFNDTIGHNIAMGKQDPDRVFKEEIISASEFALLRLTISDMTDGMDTMVGSNGTSLSGGQRQRVAIARARIRDTSILILDESTSALDHVNRSLIMDAIRIWRRGRTTIIITHDISQIEHDDYAYVLENGQLVQEGYRKHMERIKDSPFQNFLPPEQRAQISPYDSRKHSDQDWRSRPSTVPSWPLMSPTLVGEEEADDEEDLVDAFFPKAGEQRASFLPTGVTQGVFAGLQGNAFGGSYNASPWLRLADTYPSPRTPSSEDIPSPLATKPAKDTRASKRLSTRQSTRFSKSLTPIGRAVLIDNFMEKTGALAVESRSLSKGQRRQIQSTQMDDIALNPDDNIPTMSLLTVYKTVWPSLSPRYRIAFIISFLLCGFHATTTPIMSLMVSRLIDTYTETSTAKHNALVYSVVILGIAFFDAFCVYFAHIFLEATGQRWVDSIRDQIVQRILDQPRDWFTKDSNSISHLTEVMDRHGDQTRNLYGRFLSMIFIAFLMIIVALVWALIVQWKLTLIALSVGPYVWFVTRAFGTVSKKWESLSNDASEESGEVFTEVLTSIRTVRALTLESYFLKKYLETTTHCLRIGMQRALYTAFFYGLSESSSSFTQALVFYAGAVILSHGTATVSSVTLVFLMLIMTITNVSAILNMIPQLSSSQDSATKFLTLASLPNTSHEHTGTVRLPHLSSLSFDNVTFAYPSRPQTTVLRNITLTIPPRTHVAITGPSGSGKSTIASLLLNLYPLTPGNGDISLSGRSIKHISTPSLRSRISIVPQTPVLFPTSIRENISYGAAVDSPFATLQAITSAAAKAGIHDFITSLPDGYDTLIGDGGTGVSGGQAQRIAIARALVRRPDVLVLDEATSALDAEAGRGIAGVLKRLVEAGLTVVSITHKAEVMALADWVVVLEAGRVVEQGRFGEVMGRGGVLARLLSEGLWEGGGGRDEERMVDEEARNSASGPELWDVDWKSKGKRKGKGVAL